MKEETTKGIDHLAWMEGRPLLGRRLLVARASAGPSEIAAQLRGLGAEVIEAPEVQIAEPDSWAQLDAALERLRQFDAVAFACAAGVDATLRRIGATGHDVRALRLVAIGRQPAQRLRASALSPALVVDGACRDAADNAGVLRGGRLLLVTGEEGREAVVEELRALGVRVETASAYRTLRHYPRLRDTRFDLVVIGSSSGARAILEGDFGRPLVELPMLALGPITEAAARELGASKVVRTGGGIGGAVRKVVELLAGYEQSAGGSPSTSPAGLSPTSPTAKDRSRS